MRAVLQELAGWATRRARRGFGIVASVNVASIPCLSDIIWPSAGAFAAMALLGKMDQILEPKGLSMAIAPLGAVCAVLFATPSTPAARKYSMFMTQRGCAAMGVLAFTLFGAGRLARSVGLAACNSLHDLDSSHSPSCCKPSSAVP